MIRFQRYPQYSKDKLHGTGYNLHRTLVLLTCFTAVNVNGAVAAKGIESPSVTEGILLVVNKGDQSLSIIDPAAGVEKGIVAENAVTGHEVAASLDGKNAFVPIYGSGGVGSPGTDGSLLRVIDIKRGEIINTVDFGHGVRPHCAVTGPKTGQIYVTTELDQSVTVIDPATYAIKGTIPTGKPESHMLAITRDERLGYTANVASGTVSVLDLGAKTILAVIPVAPKIQRIALSVDDRRVFTADQTRPRLAVIDATTNRVSDWVALPGLGFSTAPTPDGRSLLVTLSGMNRLVVVDLLSLEVTRSFDLPHAPQEVIVRPDGAVAYVSCDATRQVAVIDLKAWKIARMIPAGRGADGLAWVPLEREH